MKIVKNSINTNLNKKSQDFQRLFHGRGGVYIGFEDITVDKINKICLLSIFKPISYEEELLVFLKSFSFQAIVVQKRYEKQTDIIGTLEKENYAIEHGLRYTLNLTDNQNIGFFADMKNGRRYITKIAKNKKVLNLFSYTCSLSVAALKGNAKQVVNVDMAKNALNTGRINHQINNVDMKKVKFLPFNILKSWSKIRKFIPYDLVIIDPPSFQKGSFEAKKDYEKIIKKLEELTSQKAIVFACLNDPFLDSNFLIEKFKEFAPNFRFIRKIHNAKDFPSLHDEKSLKCLVFKNY